VADGKGIERTQVGRPAESQQPDAIRGVEETVASAPPVSGVEATQAASAPPISGVEATQVAASAPPGVEPPGDGAPAVAAEQLIEVSPGHYEIQEELARGGMGRILIARDRRIGRTVALKELLGTGDAMFRRFEREALVTGRLQHPAIVPVYEAGRWPSGEPFFAMKLVKGTSLDKKIADKPTLHERLALLPTIIQIAEALAYAHSEHIIHRDLKPQNVLVGAYGETVVVDWGLAKDLTDGAADSMPAISTVASPAISGDLTMAGSVMGTPTYMPVEQARGLPLDERCDVYALGAILYHTLAGKPPYSGRTADEILDKVNLGPPAPIAEVVPGVPEELAAIVDKAMARKLADRYRTAKDLAAELTAFQAGQLVAAHRYSRWALIKRFARRHRAALSAAAALLVIGGVIAIVSVRQVVSARDDARRALATVEREKRAFLVEEGRQELVSGRTTKAATLLGEVYKDGAPDDYTRMLLAHAMQPLDAAIARIDTVAIHDLGALASSRFVAIDETDQLSIWTLDGRLLERPAGAGHTLAINQDGTAFAFHGPSGIEVVRAANLERVARLDVGDLGVAAIAFSPDGEVLYAVVGEGEQPATLRSWRLADRAARELRLDVAAEVVSSLSVVTTGAVYVQTQEDGVRMIAPDLAKLVKLPGDTVRASGDGGYVAFGITEDAGARMTTIGVFAAAELAQPAAAIPDAAAEFLIDRRGKRVLQLPGASDAVLCEVTKAEVHAPLARIPGVRAMLSPDGTRIASVDDNHLVRLWDDRGEVIAVWPGHTREVSALAFTPDGQALISAGEDGIRTWRVGTAEPVWLAATGISDGAGSPDGRELVVFDRTRTLLVDAATGAPRREFASGPGWSAALSPDGRRLVTSASTGGLTIWDVASGNRLFDVDVYAWSARFSPSGASVVTAGDVDGHVIDVATGKDVVLDGADLVRSARFSADGNLVITGGHDGVARVHDARTGALITSLRGHTDYLIDASFDATGTRAITASGDRTARLWDLRTGVALGTFAHPSPVLAAEIAGDRILTVARDGGRVWDARTMHQLAALGGTTEPVVGGKFLRGGTAIATFTAKLALIWETSRGAALFTLPPRPPPSRLVTIQMEAAVEGGETVDPRKRQAELVAIGDDRVAFARAGRVAIHELGREQRPAATIAELIRTRGDWKLADGGLVPVHDLIERQVADKTVTMDFSEDVVIGAASRPELELVDEPANRAGAVGQILEARAAAAAGKRRELRMLVAAIPDLPDVPGRLLYVLAWLRHDLGDDLAAWNTLRAAAIAPGWRAAETRTLARELARFAAAADVPFDDTVAAVRATSKLASVELLTMLDEIYRETGELVLEQRVLAQLMPLVPRSQLAPLELRQARHALEGGDPRELRRLAVSALGHLGALDADRRGQLRKDLVDLAARAIRYHDSTKDESYLRAAHRILRVALPAIPDGDPLHDQVAQWLSETERRIAMGVNALGALRQNPVREVMRARHSQFRRCYERSLVADPKLAGSLTLSFAITGQRPGKVTVASSTLADPKVEACITRELAKLTFPRARYAGVMQVTYPFVFQTDGS